jgi:hypothetical protein
MTRASQGCIVGLGAFGYLAIGSEWLYGGLGPTTANILVGVGGSMLSVGSAAWVAVMGQARGIYTFFAHLKWTWAIALGYAASIATHMWLNASTF